jgi:hypothetical protein
MIKWLYDKEEAKKHPILSGAFVGIGSGLGFGILSYVRFANRNTGLATVLGLIVCFAAFGLIVTRLTKDGAGGNLVSNAGVIFDLSLLAASVACFVLAAAFGMWSFVIAASVFGCLGGALLVSRRRFHS